MEEENVIASRRQTVQAYIGKQGGTPSNGHMAVGLIIACIITVFVNIGVEWYINEQIRINDVLIFVLLTMAILIG